MTTPADPAPSAAEALAAARERYTARNPESRVANTSAAQVMPGGNTRSVLHFEPFPLCFARGEGARLIDMDGHAYTDFLGEYTAGIYGHSHAGIRQAVQDAVTDGFNLSGHHCGEVPFAEAICRRFGLERIRLTNSGTEANLMALTAARVFTGRERIAVFDGGYHGGVLYFSKGRHRVNVPFDYLLLDYNDVEGSRRALEANANDLAAVLVEPMLGSGGCILGTTEFLAMLKRVAREHGIILIFDEIMTSRIGRGGLAADLGLEPDLKTLGKYIAGGMSVGAFGGRAAIMDQFDPRRPNALPHAGTFNNNTLTVRVGHRALTQIYTPEAATKLTARGDRLRHRLNALVRDAQAPVQVTGTGSMMNVHFTRERVHNPAAARRGNDDLRSLLFFHFLEDRIYISPRGMINLSLPLTDDDLDHFVASTDNFLRRYRELLL